MQAFYTGMPISSQPSVTSNRRARVVALMLVVLAIVLITAGIAWVQWAGQRGLVLAYPVPRVHISPTSSSTILINHDFQFSAAASGRDLSYTWDFGDNNTASGPSVTHAYASNGNFTVSVTVTDPLGRSSTDTTNVTVVPPPPTASFTFSVDVYGYATFDATGSTADPSTSISNYHWDFGDGGTDDTSSPQDSHQYYNTGTYQVTLTVTDGTGQQSQPYTATVTV